MVAGGVADCRCIGGGLGVISTASANTNPSPAGTADVAAMLPPIDRRCNTRASS